jgi:hypothetical protein
VPKLEEPPQQKRKAKPDDQVVPEKQRVRIAEPVSNV